LSGVVDPVRFSGSLWLKGHAASCPEPARADALAAQMSTQSARARASARGEATLLLDLSGGLSAWLILALQTYRREGQEWRYNGVGYPRELAELQQLLADRVRAGQQGSPLGGAQPAPDSEEVSPRLVGIPGAARMLEVSASTVKRLVRAGELPAVHVGDCTRFRIADVDTYVKQLRADPPTPKDVA